MSTHENIRGYPIPKTTRLLPLLALLLLAQNARADTVWQIMFLDPRLLVYTWWIIPLGLLIEWPAVHKMAMFSWEKSFKITCVMNAVSFFAGIFLQIPTMSMGGWRGTYAILTIAILGSTFIEGFIINLFKKGAFSRKTFPLLLLVNILSGGITVLGACAVASLGGLG